MSNRLQFSSILPNTVGQWITLNPTFWAAASVSLTECFLWIPLPAEVAFTYLKVEV